MKSEKIHHMGLKKTEITDLRPKFLQTVLNFALMCNDNQLQHLENKFSYILQSIQRRHLLDSESDQPKELNMAEISHHLTEPLKDVIESFKVSHPISYLLATLFFVKHKNMDLEQSSIEKLLQYAKHQAKLETTIPDLTDSMRREICIKLGQFLRAYAGHLSDAVWLLGLFYKVLSPASSPVEGVQLPDSRAFKWMQNDAQCQKELREMVKHHEQQLQQHRHFAQYVLCDMFSVELGHHDVLKYLGFEPLQFLCELHCWLQEHPHIVASEKLADIIGTIADITKKWFQSRQPDKISHEHVLGCVSMALKIIKGMQLEKQGRQLPKNMISSLRLLNSFSKVLEPLKENKEIMDINMSTYPEVEKHLKSCIMVSSEKITEDKLQVSSVT
ncbi:uncharacterized protein LOC118801814 [Colossoma macropomum]|uniref:uncharacterized protein LOC118801814 n=1 Tax=Colossoma macropomum TaxID=42526 RepID=UPI001864184A|nr:uncharacterized protein LOC118801814 [Colossoma macropomum]